MAPSSTPREYVSAVSNGHAVRADGSLTGLLPETVEPAHSERHAIPVRDRRGPAPSKIGSLVRLLAKGRGVRTNRSVSRLIEKRRELAQLIETLQEQLDQTWADLAHIDGALRLLGTHADPERIGAKHRYQRAPYFGRNELSRLVLATLRAAAGQPLGIEEISRRVIVVKRFDPGDANLRAAVQWRVRAVLTRLHKQGEITGISGRRGSKWKLAGA